MSRRSFWQFPVLALLGLVLFGCASSGDSPVLSTVDSLISREIEQENLPGAVIQIQQAGTVLHRKAYGYAHLYDYGMTKLDSPEVMTTGHLFDLASLTKVFATTFGMMLLVDDGKIHLDTPVHKYLPKFTGVHKDSITVRHLLTHTSGLFQWQPLYYHGSTSAETFDYICDLPLRYAVGKERHYSDLGFMLLGYITERVSEQSLDAFLKENLYHPLHLRNTTFTPKTFGYGSFAATSHGNPFEHHMVADDDFGYYCTEDPASFTGWRHYTLMGEVNDGNSYYGNQGIAGHAGLFSTIDDLQVMVNFLLAKGNFQGEQIITESTINTFLTRDTFGNGLGWGMEDGMYKAADAPPGTFGHTGFTGTNVLVVPEYRLSIILLTNRQNVGVQESGYYYNLNPLRRAVAAAVFAHVGIK